MATAAPDANCQFEQIAREILAQAQATDEAEDEVYGEDCGDELPEQLRTPEGRREFFRRAKEQLCDRDERSEPIEDPDAEVAEEVPLEFDPARIVARVQGREGWLREGKRQLERHRWQHPDPIPRARPDRLLLAAGRLQSELEVERRANAAYEHYRATRATSSDGGCAGGRTLISRRRCRPGA